MNTAHGTQVTEDGSYTPAEAVKARVVTDEGNERVVLAILPYEQALAMATRLSPDMETVWLACRCGSYDYGECELCEAEQKA